ncbi:MAG: HAMP domain-containing histidine kinase [Bacteroidetes bacterium]|nr:MAG: HAMP domain-containing histidine kinase [Bacteroidota bacterium]
MRLRLLQILMTITILGIIAFQGYWLRENYKREEKTLSFKTDVAFRETVRQLQEKNLKLGKSMPFLNDSIPKGNMRVFVNSEHPGPEIVNIDPHRELATTLNIVGQKIKDSVLKRIAGKNKVMITMDNSSVSISKDSMRRFNKEADWFGPDPEGKENYIMQLLYSVDSLQDSIKLKDVQLAYTKVLENQKIDIPFSITKTESKFPERRDEPNRVTVGFANPVTFSLVKGNTFPYLLKRIASPLLFSVFLIALTILSFVLLYRNMKKQQRLAELKNDFISNITHELKTPIATVGVAIEALKNFNAMQSPERTKEYLDISSNELNRLNLLVDKVLKLSMFEKKEIQLNLEAIDLRSLADEVLASMRLQLEKKNASVILTHSGNTSLMGDRLHLLSVVFNLVDNALKYSPENPDIKIAVEEKENNVELRVADNGVGIPDEYKTKVFEKFFRVPAGNVHNIKGYGLGLSYAASVVKKHGGTIEAKNNEGGGTSFTITLPKNQS